MDDSEYWNKHKNFILNTKHKKGHGYYIWKPYLIQKTMNKMNDGDILLYSDAGCEYPFTSGLVKNVCPK